VQYWKQALTSISTEAGMQIDFSDEQQKNAASSIRRRLEFASNVTLSRRSLDKHASERISTDAGMQIERSDEHGLNARAPICFSFELGSKIGFLSAEH
jgi:negative regulator of genetic competence, sporulation and motility